jgi:hypothetical protein
MYQSPPRIAPRLTVLRSIHTTPTWAKKVKIPDPNVPKKEHIPTPKEVALQFKRRVQKAERDERMDISMSLTEVKTFVVTFGHSHAISDLFTVMKEALPNPVFYEHPIGFQAANTFEKERSMKCLWTQRMSRILSLS